MGRLPEPLFAADRRYRPDQKRTMSSTRPSGSSAEGQTYYEQALFDLASESLNAAQDLWRRGQRQRSGAGEVLAEPGQAGERHEQQARGEAERRPVLRDRQLSLRGAQVLPERRQSHEVRAQDARRATAFDSAQQNISYVTRPSPSTPRPASSPSRYLKSTDPEAYKISLPGEYRRPSALLAIGRDLGLFRGSPTSIRWSRATPG